MEKYAELVWDQRIDTWLLCHRHAFEFFGAVPARLVPDNLKAAIVKASFTEPVAQRSYRECAAHYGFLIDPQPPRAPWLKEWVSYCTSLACFEDNLGTTWFVLPFGR